MLPPPRSVAWIFPIGVMVLGADGVSSQNYPNKPIRIAASEPGGNADFNARLIAPGLANALGQPVIVENRRGQIVSPQTVLNATPDGYTLLVTGSAFWIGPLLRKTSYEPLKDFSPITLTTLSPNVLVLHPSLPVKSVPELIALAKAKPGGLNYAAASTGSPPHLAGELFKAMAGINIAGIPYKSAGPALTDLLGGQVQMMFSSVASVVAHIKSGRLNALAVTSAQPSALFPGLPTIAASGLPGYESTALQGLWAPAKTPATLINRLNQETVRVLNAADMKERLLGLGVEVAACSPERFAATVKSEVARLGKVIRDAGIRDE